MTHFSFDLCPNPAVEFLTLKRDEVEQEFFFRKKFLRENFTKYEKKIQGLQSRSSSWRARWLHFVRNLVDEDFDLTKQKDTNDVDLIFLKALVRFYVMDFHVTKAGIEDSFDLVQLKNIDFFSYK